MQLGHGLDQRGRCRRKPDAPACHAIGFRDTVQRHDPVRHIRGKRRQRVELKPVIDQMLIQIIRQHHHLAVRANDIGQRAQLIR